MISCLYLIDLVNVLKSPIHHISVPLSSEPAQSHKQSAPRLHCLSWKLVGEGIKEQG